MKFSGRFADFSLPDVLRILVHSQKSGYLTIFFKNTENRIYMSQGQLYHAESEGLSGEQAIFNLMSFDSSAEFEFHETEALPLRTLDSELDVLLQNGIAYLEDWRRLTRQHPLLSMHSLIQLPPASVQSLPPSAEEQELFSLLQQHPAIRLNQLAGLVSTPLSTLAETLVGLEKSGLVQLIGEERLELQQFFLEMANTLMAEFESISGLKLKEETLLRLQKFVEENNWNIELQNGRIVGDKIRVTTLDEQKNVFSAYLRYLISLIEPIYGSVFIQQVMQKLEKQFSAPVQHWVDELKIEV
jgi:hypothetical protein